MYKEIINKNRLENCSVSWWPLFAFHYTDVTNAANILSSGYLYCRTNATKSQIMKNDNASRQVINITNPAVKSFVRLYFRPLTPTQYYNEGFKHPLLRYNGDSEANVPVPIFLLFDLEKILSISNISFSEFSQANSGSELLKGVESFKNLNFAYIYSNDMNDIEKTKKYRHAEILCPKELEIEPYIKNILCRTNLERLTLLNMIRDKSNIAFIKYRDKIKVFNENIFEYNGLYLTECICKANELSIGFSDTLNAKKYIKKMKEKLSLDYISAIKGYIHLKWINNNKTIYEMTIEFSYDYMNPYTSLKINDLPSFKQARQLLIKVFLEDKIIGYFINSLEDIEIIK